MAVPRGHQVDPVEVTISTEADVIAARTLGKEMARSLGFGLVDQTRIATGISELARNILQYAGHGRMAFVEAGVEGRRGLAIEASDEGPGIANLQALLDGQVRSTKGLGLGILGTRRLMDEFEIHSQKGQGTQVRCVKWL